MRTGLWISGAGGSGILIARKEDGTWSPPSGILLHTAGLGFLVGVDIYDCVLVLNTTEALEAFQRVRCTLGGEVSAVAGPVGMGGVMETEVHKRRSPIFTYLKSRGFYAGIQVDGTIIIERNDENEKFYREKISAGDILKGKLRHPPEREYQTLITTIRAAEGFGVDEELLPEGQAPADFDLEEPGHTFGIPDQEDPDPFGFVALQQQGLEIREAGSKERASQDEFDFRPSPTSPVHQIIKRQSTDSRDLNRNSTQASRRNSWRISAFSTASKMTDSATQTDTEELDQRSPQRSPFSATFPPQDLPYRRNSKSPAGSSGHRSMEGIPEQKEAPRALGPPPALPPRNKTPASPPPPIMASDDDEDADDADAEEDAVVHKVHTASVPSPVSTGVQVVSKPRLVTVKKVPPPMLPARNPGRTRNAGSIDAPISPISASSSMNQGKGEESSEASSRQTRAESISSSSEAKGSPDANNEKEINGGLQEVDLARDAWRHEGTRGSSEMKERQDDGFQEVDLSKPWAMEATSAAAEAEADRKAHARMSGDMRSFAAGMRMDDDESDGDVERKTPGAW